MNDDEIYESFLAWTPNVPLPPKHLYDKYRTKYEKQIKGKILENEIAMMERKYNAELEKTMKNVEPFKPSMSLQEAEGGSSKLAIQDLQV